MCINLQIEELWLTGSTLSVHGHLNTAEVLFQRGADINKQNKVKSLVGGTCIRE